MAIERIIQLCGEDSKKWGEALNYSKEALELRIKLWDGILIYLENKKSLIPVE